MANKDRGRRVKSMSIEELRRFVIDEAKKMGGFGDVRDIEDVPDPDEVDADAYAGSLEKQVNFLKALKVERRRLRKRLIELNERERRLTRHVNVQRKRAR